MLRSTHKSIHHIKKIKMKNFKLLVPANLSFSAGVREIAWEAACIAGFSDKQKNMLKLVVDELFMNAIRYGSSSDSHIFIEGIIDGEKIIFAIEDEGKGKDAVNAEKLKSIINQQLNNSDLEKVHGRGLAQITSKLVEAYEIHDKEDGGLRFEFVMSKEAETAKETEAKTDMPKKSTKILAEKRFELTNSIDLNNMEKVEKDIENIFSEHSGEAFRLILDFSKLEYCNSTFLGQLAAWHTRLNDIGGEIVIFKPSKNIYEIIDLVGLTNLFIIEK